MLSKGPLPKTDKSDIFVLVLCDCFMYWYFVTVLCIGTLSDCFLKWTEAYAIPNQDFLAIIREYICRLVIPLWINNLMQKCSMTFYCDN